MAIHHAVKKKAEKNGIILAELNGGGVSALYPKYNLREEGMVAKDVMDALLLKVSQRQIDEANFDGTELVKSPDPEVEVQTETLTNERGETVGPDGMTEEELSGKAGDSEPGDEGSEAWERGRTDYAAGILTADCPYNVEAIDDEVEVDRANDWYGGWDEAADERSEQEDKEPGGSVVSPKYRARYAEAGHPTHCGDWLAETLNGLVLNKEGVNLELFEEICGWNGVDTSKYKRSGVGWQGRIRMTGRNLMAKRVYEAGGKLKLTPELAGNDEGILQAPAEWMTTQRFKKGASA